MAVTASEPPRAPIRRLLSNSLRSGQIYLLLSAVVILLNARLFYDSLRMQTEHVLLWTQAEAHFRTLQDAWSAPLDDVFIHFDFARATAAGYPFQWIPENGYSSGGTSLLYPFVLALGYWLGFSGLSLMKWAALVACVSVFSYLQSSRTFFRNLPPWSALLCPIIALSVGALNWTLFSGMEVALFLAIWAYCAYLWDQRLSELSLAPKSSLLPKHQFRKDAYLGLACAFLVMGRPEAAPLVAIFGIWISLAQWRASSLSRAVVSLVSIGAPGALILIAHMLTNHVLTGDSAAAGALAKLEIHHPYMDATAVWDSWLFFIRYQFMRLSAYHFSSVSGLGFLLWPLALLSLVFKKTRRFGILLWLSMLTWTALVALNGQVRWQNERYAMPTVAWLLLAVSLGLGAGLDFAYQQKSVFKRSVFALTLAGAFSAFLFGQSTRFNEQVWFFGRASRNILEQHVRAGLFLGSQNPRPHRLLLSDAGALPYVSGLPAFDLIGLGGYGGLPISKASRQGVGGALELLEYLPESQRPDLMATYPGWWGNLVLWFGRPLRDFTVRGNVICGGSSKVIYGLNWAPLENSGTPFALKVRERLVDTLDLADLISEKAHQFKLNAGTYGYLNMRILDDPRNTARGLWDAGRMLHTHNGFQAKLDNFQGKPSYLLLRTVVANPATFSIKVQGSAEIRVTTEPKDAWQEIRIPLPPLTGSVELELKVESGSLQLHHLFVVEAQESRKAVD